VSVEGFSIGKPVMFVYATLVTIAILEFFAALSALGILSFGAAIFSGQNPVTSSGSDLFQQFTALVGIMSLPSVFFAIYLLGRWVGARCGRNGLWLMPVALVAARAIDYAAMALYSPEAWRQTRQIFIGREVIGVIIVFVLLALAGDSGVLRGNRIRIGTYLNYLLKQVPKETQDTILNIAFEEASKSTSKASVATA
jgi:hypothetical protein